jgi:hypothetical protein
LLATDFFSRFTVLVGVFTGFSSEPSETSFLVKFLLFDDLTDFIISDSSFPNSSSSSSF